jgi:hypothetical protein
MNKYWKKIHKIAEWKLTVGMWAMFLIGLFLGVLIS